MIRASDAKSWALCLRRVWFDCQPGEVVEDDTGEFDQLIIELGLEHEQAVLDTLRQQYDVHTAHSVEHTAELMQQRVDVIYQAQLRNDEEGLIGYPDFLFLHEDGDYQAGDAKLSRNI